MSHRSYLVFVVEKPSEVVPSLLLGEEEGRRKEGGGRRGNGICAPPVTGTFPLPHNKKYDECRDASQHARYELQSVQCAFEMTHDLSSAKCRAV